MSTYLILSIIGTIFCTLCIGIFIWLFNIPPSLSETYYNLENRKKGTGMLFYAYLVITVFIIIAPIVEATGFWGFLTCIMLCLVGAAPAFKNKHDRPVHIIGAIGACVGSLICLIVMKEVWLIFAVAALIGLISWLTKSYKTSYIFWVEMLAFYGSLFGLIIFFI